MKIKNQIEETSPGGSDRSEFSCPYCKSEQLADLGPCRKPEQRSHLPSDELAAAKAIDHSVLMSCKNCQLIFRAPMPSPEQIALIYRSLPAERWLTGRKEVNSWEHAIRWLVSNFSRDKSLRILDVGTFDGRFLLELPVAWNKYCLEPSECNRQQLENNGIHRVGDFISDLATSQQKPFDVITMFDVFEHLDNPRESLSQLVRHLAPNGYLIISTADSEHWTWNLRGDHWYVQSIQHLIIGSASFFQYAVKDLDCRLVKIIRHPHMRHSLLERIRQSLETIEFLWRRADGVCRLLSFGIRQLPGFRSLIHRTTAPHGSGLSDHLLVILQPIPTTSKKESQASG